MGRAYDAGEEDAEYDAEWIVEDGHGTAITTGLQEHEAHRVAQDIADARGEAVYLWAPDADEAEEIEPE